jgi:hypothetical protein
MELIARALEWLGPVRTQTPDFSGAAAFVFQAEKDRFVPVPSAKRPPRQRAALCHIEQAAFDAPRDGGERAFHGHQPSGGRSFRI